MTDPNKRSIFFWNMTRWSSLYSPLARSLKENHDINTVIFTYGYSILPSKKLFGFDPEDFCEIVDVEPLLHPRSESELPSAREIANEAKQLKKRCGVNLLDILRTDRHLGIDFVTGADFMRSKFGKSHNYLQSIDMLLRLCHKFEGLISKYQPISVIAWPGSVGPAALIGVANGSGVPMRTLLIARYGKNFCWVIDKHGTPHGFDEAFTKNLGATSEINKEDIANHKILTAAPERTKRVLDNYQYRASVRFLFISIYRQLRMLAGNFVHKRTKVYGNYLLWDWLKLFIDRWRWRRHSLKETPILDSLPSETPFVFFPLHIEPESTMMVEAQMCDNQLALLDWTVKSIPAGWYVLVKEHPGATSPRPKGFWQRIKRYPNVIVASTLESAALLVEKAKAVASINGTTGVQAALDGCPVISFHPKFIANCLPHVLLATSYSETRAALDKIEQNDLPSLSVRYKSAKAFADGLEDCTFPIEHRGLQLGIPDETPISKSDVEITTATLLSSLYSPNKEETYVQD